jgi:DNA-binding CsgD family transcriptional regulator
VGFNCAKEIGLMGESPSNDAPGGTGARLDSRALARLLDATDWNSLRIAVQELLAALDVDDFLLRMDRGSCPATGGSHLFGSVPADALATFDRQMQDQDNFLSRHVRRSPLPLAWQVAQICAVNNGSACAALRAYGITHGVSVGVRGEHSLSRIDFYRLGQSPAYSATEQSDLMLLASYLHEAGHLLWRQQECQALPVLTEREHECLYWSAGGKTSKETAMILGISQHTVYFHLKNAAGKFQVNSTRQAITQAIWRGLVKPMAA